MSSNPLDNGYKMVAERHAKFVEDYPNGAIDTRLVQAFIAESSGENVPFIIMRCDVWKDREDQRKMFPPDGVGHASMPIPGPTAFTKNSEVENAETSALGRALAMIGYHAKDSLASEDEIASKGGTSTPERKPTGASPDAKATIKQLNLITSWGRRLLGDDEEVKQFIQANTGKKSRKQLTNGDVQQVIDLYKVMEAANESVDEAEEAEE